MLKKIAVADLRLGMHLHALEGPWLAHPFWRTKFLLDDGADLHAVIGSGVSHCWIDSSKGLDVAVAASVESAVTVSTEALNQPHNVEADAALPELLASDPVPEPSVSFEDELKEAVRLCKKSKLAV